MDVTMGGLFQAYMDDGMNWVPVSMFDADGDGSFDDCPTADPATTTSCTWTVSFGELFGAGQANDIEVYSNLSMEPPTMQNASDIGETRQIPAFQTAYTFAGTIQGDSANANGVGVFTVQSSLSQYKIYELVATDYGGPGHESNIVNEMKETAVTLDDRNGNNDALLTATFASYHDAQVVNVEAGNPRQESGRLDAGMTRVFATVAHSGSDRTINYDWAVQFNVKDSNGQDVMGSPFMANECDNPDDPQGSTAHEYLGEMFPSQLEATACAEIMLNPGMVSLSATVDLLDASLTDTDPANDCGTGSNPDCKADMNSANDMRTGHFEVLNMGPSAYLTMDEVEGDIIDGTRITFSARAEHLGQPDLDQDGNPDPFGYTWSMSGQQMDPQLDVCSGMEDPMTGMIMGGSPDCTVDMNIMWLGSPTMIVTVSDYWGARASAQLTFSVWNNYSNDDSGDCWDAEYDIRYAGSQQYTAEFSDADDATGETLSGSSGWDSVCTFNIDVSAVLAPADVNSEDLTLTLDADPSVGHSLWYEGGTGWVELSGTTQTQIDADTISLSWSNDGSLPSRTSSRYGVFASATIGQPPQIGIDSLTATLGSAGVIDLSWAINGSLVSANDYGVLYVNDDGAALDGTRSTFDLTTTTHTIAGTHGTTYEFLVRVENGEVDSNSNSLYGTPVDSGSATADGQVDPTAGATGLEATSSGESSIHFTWTSADSSDVNHWMICWSPSQHTSLEVTSLITANSCHTTADSSMDVTIDRHSGSGVFYYSVNAMDSVGNMETADSSAGLRFTDDSGPGVNVDDTIGVEGGDGEIPTQAWIAIGILVLVAVIAGAFILTRGGGEGDSDEFDY
tara:strand:- start:5413 stop:7959 length:2547 start_codon:yes stop_codon:yes gene_type:complete